MKTTYVYDPVAGRLVPKAEVRRTPRAPAIQPDLEPFVSPVDRSVVSSRSVLRAHNARHGVALQAEYGERDGAEYFRRANQERLRRQELSDPQTDRERREALIRATEHIK